MPSMQRLVKRRAVLDPAIRMMHQGMASSPLAQRPPEGLRYRFGMQAFMHVVSNDFRE